MIRKLLSAILLFATYSAVYADSRQYTDDERSVLAETALFLENWQRRLVSYAENSEQLNTAEIIQTTSIRISNELTLPSIAYAFHESNREILISDEYILAVNAYAPLIEAYFSEHLQDTTEYEETFPFYKLALLDVLFHEMGHHATDAMYSSNASRYRVAKAEKEAENWSYNQKLDFGIDKYELGRIISLFSVLAYHSSMPNTDSDNYRWQRAVLESSAHQACFMSSSHLSTKLCNPLSNDGVIGDNILTVLAAD